MNKPVRVEPNRSKRFCLASISSLRGALLLVPLGMLIQCGNLDDRNLSEATGGGAGASGSGGGSLTGGAQSAGGSRAGGSTSVAAGSGSGGEADGAAGGDGPAAAGAGAGGLVGAGGVPTDSAGGTAAGGDGGSAGQGAVDACSPNPCGAGTCIPHLDSFLCDCGTAYLGERCELPRFEGLGFLLGDTDSFALDVSGDGRVVVGRSSVQVGAARIETPFYWTHEAGMQPLVTFAGRATATNSDGSVVVGTRAEGQAFRWIAGKGVTDLGVPTGGTTAAVDTSEDGGVVIGMSTAPSAGATAFRWTATEGLAPIDSTIASVTGVSRDGSVIVGSRQLAAGETGFRWSASGGFVDFVPGEATSTFVVAMTSDGSVAFGYGVFSGAYQLFRWPTDQASAKSFLRIPSAITDAGQIVAVRSVSDSPERTACYVSVPARESKDENQTERIGSACFSFGNPASAPRLSPNVIDVAATLRNGGIDLEGWTLTRSTSISADGAVLVGNGIDPEGKSQAWIARLP